MLWHRRFEDQPAHRWLRDTLTATANTIQHGQEQLIQSVAKT
jgi:hypothetical protein